MLNTGPFNYYYVNNPFDIKLILALILPESREKFILNGQL